MQREQWFALSFLVLLVHGCTAATPIDAALDGALDATALDTSAPADVPTPRALFARCTENTQCGPLGRCLLIYPGGLCSRRCATDDDCGDTGLCAGSLCFPRCSLGGGECPQTQACERVDTAVPNRRQCFPACSEPAGGGEPRCAVGFVCDLYSFTGDCTRTAPNPGGRNNGEPCVEDDDCKGDCRPGVFDGEATGWTDGYCRSFGRIPEAAAYAPRLSLPRSNCPVGSVIVPYDDNADEGDTGSCLKECRTREDCRGDYGCFFYEFVGGARSSTGFCDSINCLHSRFTSLPNHGCAATSECVPYRGSLSQGFCTPMARGDGGVDGGDGATADVPDPIADGDSGTVVDTPAAD